MSSNDLYEKLMGKYSGSGEASSQEEPKSKSSGHQQTYEALMAKYNPEVNENYVNRFIKDANSFVGKYGNDVGYITGRNIYDKNSDALDDLNTRARILSRYFKNNADRYENPDQVTENFASITSALEKYGSYLKSQQDYYSQWDTEDDYNAFLEYDAKSKFDLKKGQKEIEDLESLLEKYKSAKQGADFIPKVEGKTEMESLMDLVDSTEKEISQKKQYMNQARHIQEGAKLSSVANPFSDNYDHDFGDLSRYSTTIKESTSWWQGRTEDTQYEWINNQNGFRDSYEKDMDTLNEVAAATTQSSFYVAPTESAYRKKGYDHLTKNEIAIYNYYYAKDGKDKAQEYLDSIQETLNYRKATKMYGELEDNTAQELIFGVEAGLDQFASGMKNLFNTVDDYIPQSAAQMTSGMVRADLADAGAKLPDWMGGASLGQVGYDVITTSANMAPSILTSVAVGMLNPIAGQVAGNALMGMSAAGGAYQEALNEGYDKNQARGYGLLVGASEIVMEKILGGISALGGNALGKSLTQNLTNADTALKMIAKKLGASMLSEFSEEYLQEVLTPVFQNLMLGTDNEVKLFSAEALYSGILGALTAGIMEGPTAIAGEVSVYNTGKDLQKADVSAQRLADIGKTFSADTVAHQLAGKVNENTTAYAMGRLFNEIGATLTEQNVNDITNALVSKGMNESVARSNAEALAYVVEGGQLTDAQVAIIEANEVLAEAARTTLIDANTTWNQRSQNYNEVLKSLAQEKASRMNPAEAEQENAPTSDKVDAKNKEGSEADSEAETATPKVKSIATIEDGKVTVKMEDGTEVNVKESGIDPDDGVRIETIASIDGISTTDANFILNTLRVSPGTSAQVDSLGAKEAYKYGFYGFSQDHIAKHGVFANALTDTQRQAIYDTGRAARQKQVDNKNATVDNKNATVGKKKATTEKNSATGKVHFDGDRSALTERQNASLTAMERVAEVLGVQIHVFESQVNERGKRIGANGWYDPKDSSIHIDLHAGATGEGTMLFTLAHELTHHIRKWSPAKFKVLADFLMQEYGKKGVNVDALVREQMAKAKRSGRTISYDTAYEEVVADSMETMLSDGNVMKRLEKLKAQDKDLWHKIKRFIDEMAAKIRAAYKGLSPDSVEGRYVAEMGEAIYRLQELFAEGLVEASENYQASLTPGEEGVVANQDGDPVAYATSDGSVLLSMRTYEEEGREAFRKYLDKCVKSKKLTKAEMQEMLDGIEEIYGVCKEFKDKYAPFSSWSDAAVVRDTYGKPVFSVVTPNGDYKMNLDFSLVCKKRRTLDAVFNEMSRRGIIDDFELGQKSVVKINEIIRKYGLETACALCFVDAKRFRQASMADTFTSLYNELVLSLVPEDQRSNIDHFNFARYATIKRVEGGIDTWDNSKLDFSHLNEVMKNYGDGTVEYKAAKYIKNHPEGRKLLLRGDFMSSQGFDAVKTQNQDIMKLYNSKKGTGGPKAAFGDVQYMNEVIQKARWWTPKKAYAVGGVRIQSFSDYVPRMVFDYTQMIYDLAATKLPAHAYTKEALFVKQFGLTGVKINMSLIPAIADGGIAPGLDANGDYVWAGESFDFETAKEIQNAEGYTENCGTICVGVSKQHILKLLSDPNIRMVIPYHKSGLNPIVAHMNKIAEFTDYTTLQTNPGGCQNTMNKNGSKVEVDFNFNEVLRKTGDPKATVRQYLDWCAKNEYTPRFAEFAWHENYYKLIEDFTLYDKDGKYVPQREVRAVFPKSDSAFGSMKDLIQEGLQEDAIIEGKRDKSLSSIVDEIQKTLPKTEAEIEETQVAQADRDLETEAKLSDRDFTYKELTAKSDLKGSVIRANQTVKLMGDGSIDRAWLVAEVLRQCESIQTKAPTPTYYVNVPDIGRNVQITNRGITHGFLKFDTKNRKTIPPNTMTNARATLNLPDILRNSIEVNRSQRGSNLDIDFSRVLIGVTAMEDASGAVEYYAVRSVVEERKNQDPILVSANVIGKLHAMNAKKIGKPHAQVGTNSTVALTRSSLFGYSVADLLNDVKNEFNDTFSNDVYKHFGMTRNANSFSQHLMYSDRDTAPIFYSHMARVVDGVKQSKLGAASVVSMLRGKGVKAEEIKWSGIEAFLEGKKSVTKAELQEFIAGSMLQIEEETLTDKEMPYSQEHLDQIAKFEAERDIIAETLKSEWKRIVGTDIPISYFGAGLESAVVGKLLEANSTKKGESEAGYKYKAARAALQRVIEDSDDYYGYDNARQAFSEALRKPKDFMDSFDLTSFEKSVLRDLIKAKEAYSKVEGIPMQDQKVLKDIAASADRFNSRINRVKQAHRAEAAKHLTKWSQYKIRGGQNYREVLFKIPGSYYTNAAMGMHWEEKSGVLAHARIQDLNTFLGKMLFVEEIQSDWHNDGRKDGYASEEQAVRKKVKDLQKQWDSLLEESMTASASRSYAINEKLDAIDEEKNRIEQKLRYGELAPDAPFSDNYHEYVLKRLIRMAAEQDYDSIGWTPAQIQVDRWSKKFAEAYRIEYDQEIPKFLNKYGKKWGTKVGKTVLDSGTEVWSMAITDEMKESVLTEGQPLYSERDTDSVSNRSLLANALESVAQNDIERKKIQEYKEKISLINAEEENLRALNKQLIIEKDPKNIRMLQFEANQAANRINTYDRQLLRLEASKPLKDVLTREKKMAFDRGVQKGKEALEAYRERAEKKQQETIERYQESRKRGVENRQKTAMRQKIRKTIRDLDKILNRGDKKRNVKEDMKDFVADALASAEILFTDNYSNEDMVRNGVGTDLTPEEAKFMNEARAIMDELANLPTGYDGWLARQDQEFKLKNKLSYRMAKLKDVFVRERARLNKTQVSEVLGNLADSYGRLQNSEYAHVQGAYHESVHEYLKMLQEDVGGTIVKDMTLGQLEELYKAYTMVMTTVHNANRMFAENLNNTRDALANQVMFEVHEAGGEHGLWTKAGDKLNSFSWNNEKPVYAFERIGSKTLKTLYGNIRKGQDGWAVDIQEANDFRMNMYKKYKHSNWDILKQYTFTSSSGIDFELNLDQIMSLYAYSKRAQAHDHLLKGGFVFDGNTEVVVNKKGIKMTFLNKTATAYNVSFEILENIISKLTPEQKAFVDDMQDYLSTTMGEKGNEVSMQLYGVKLFNEKFYFPLRSAGQYMEKAKEADMKQKQGQVNIANSGFSKAVKIKASNPVVLTGFMEVWAGHVNEMSMYHSFVLPMEDFRRVYNYSSPHMEGQQSASVNGVIQNAYGAAATDYIDRLYRDLNGGAITDKTADLPNKLMNLFKKGAVFASASVTIQQPSAIARATALVDIKHFIGPKVDAKRHKALWEEVKQYAPVAVIKEMGFFDTNMGRSATDFLTAEEYSGIKEKALALVKDEGYRDEQLSKAPALADELTWCVIWEAVKRETKAQNPKMNVKSEEFLKIAGDRFSEVIDKTQVYDSVLARSANMRSKDTVMKMATAFMAEPTTSINMVADALRKGKNGNKKQATRIIGSVVSSVILNSFLVAWVYAARDDDEDETYREKYLSSFISGIIDGVNPMTYIPFIKDVWSIIKGYDIERSDMAVISDLWNAYKQLKNDDVSAWRKVEGFAGSICQIFGLPVKNIMRDVRSVFQAYDTIVHGEKNTTRGTAIAIVEGITGQKPSNPEQLYKARKSGDKAHAARVEARYEDEDSANAAVRKAITDRYMDDELTLAQATMQLTQYAGMKADEAYWLMDGWKHKKETGSDDGYSKYNDFYEAVQTGKDLKAVIKEYTDNGVKMSTLSGQITSHFKDEYVAMSAGERANIKGYLLNAYEQCGVSRKSAEEKLRDWDFEAKHGGSYEEIVANYKNGDISETTMRSILADKGYSKSDIEDKISDWNVYKIYGYDYSELDDAYRAGELSREEFRQAMIDNGTFPAKADQAIITYDWMRDNAQYGLEYSDAGKYAHPIGDYGKSLADVGLNPDIYLEYKELKKGCKGVDADNDGTADSGTLRAAKFEMIDSLPITNDQKDALAAIDYGMKSIKRYAPWH